MNRPTLSPSGALTLRLPHGVLVEGAAAALDVRPLESGRACEDGASATRLLVSRWRLLGERDGALRVEGEARADWLGAATIRLEVRTVEAGDPAGAGAERVDRIQGSLLELRQRVTWRGDRPVRLERLVPLLLDPALRGAMRLPPGSGTESHSPLEEGLPPCVLAHPHPAARLLRTGFAISIPPLPLGPRDRDDALVTPPLGLALAPRSMLDLTFDPRGMPARAPGRATASAFTVLRAAPSGPALALGFTGLRERLSRLHVALGPRTAIRAHDDDWGSPTSHLPRTCMDARHDPRLPRGGLAAACDGEGMPLAPGDEIASEALVLGAARAPHDALSLWAARHGAASGARARRLRYWCTWYAAPCDRIDAAFVRDCAASLARRRAPVDHVVVDDGWQRDLGDWLETNAKFPFGLARLAASIREAGFRPGIWLAPFVASPRSALLRAHPDWVVRDGAGRPITAGFIAQLGAPRPYFALDTSRDDVCAHVARTARGLREAGFELLKVDFLTAGVIDGVRVDATCTRAGAYARGMAALRAGVGEDGVLLGAIAPLALNAGHVDAQRMGADVSFGPARWEAPFARALGDWTAPSVRASLPGPLALAALDGRLFASDADAIVRRNLSPSLAMALARMNLAVARATCLGDDPRLRGPDAVDLVRRIARAAPGEAGSGGDAWPFTGGARTLDLLDRAIPERVLARDASGAEGERAFRWGRSVPGHLRTNDV